MSDRVFKVKAHLTEADVQAGTITNESRLRNRAADRLAREAIDRAECDPQQVKTYREAHTKAAAIPRQLLRTTLLATTFEPEPSAVVDPFRPRTSAAALARTPPQPHTTIFTRDKIICTRCYLKRPITRKGGLEACEPCKPPPTPGFGTSPPAPAGGADQQLDDEDPFGYGGDLSDEPAPSEPEVPAEDAGSAAGPAASFDVDGEADMLSVDDSADEQMNIMYPAIVTSAAVPPPAPGSDHAADGGPEPLLSTAHPAPGGEPGQE